MGADAEVARARAAPSPGSRVRGEQRVDGGGDLVGERLEVAEERGSPVGVMDAEGLTDVGQVLGDAVGVGRDLGVLVSSRHIVRVLLPVPADYGHADHSSHR